MPWSQRFVNKTYKKVSRNDSKSEEQCGRASEKVPALIIEATPSLFMHAAWCNSSTGLNEWRSIWTWWRRQSASNGLLQRERFCRNSWSTERVELLRWVIFWRRTCWTLLRMNLFVWKCFSKKRNGHMKSRIVWAEQIIVVWVKYLIRGSLKSGQAVAFFLCENVFYCEWVHGAAKELSDRLVRDWQQALPYVGTIGGDYVNKIGVERVVWNQWIWSSDTDGGSIFEGGECLQRGGR